MPSTFMICEEIHSKEKAGRVIHTVIYHRGETCIDLPMKMEEAASVLRRYQRARGQVEVIDHNQPLSC